MYIYIHIYIYVCLRCARPARGLVWPDLPKYKNRVKIAEKTRNTESPKTNESTFIQSNGQNIESTFGFGNPSKTNVHKS